MLNVCLHDHNLIIMVLLSFLFVFDVAFLNGLETLFFSMI